LKTTAAFTVYDAAAGAGKTYTLVKNYLIKILGSSNKNRYKQILAVTFTNKAVAEMKSRILESLDGFAQLKTPASHQYMFNDIREILGLEKEELQQNSKAVLHYLLHNYTAFSVQTIDKFTQSVIRTFAYDLGLSTNFEVELDQNKILEKSVDNLLSQVGVDKELSKVVIDFSKSNIDDDKAWNIKKSLLETARIIFSEDDIDHIQKMSSHSFEDFQKLNKELKERKSINKEKVISLSKGMLEVFNEKGIELSFSRNYIPNYFKKVIDKGEDTFDSKWKNEIETTAFYTAKADENIKQIIDELRPDIVRCFLATKKLILETQFVDRVLKNVTQMSLLKTINDQLQELKNENQLLLISDFNKLIFETIKDQPTPFIYERLGERYKDFFIDEFQDTSVMQWQNLLPLCDNAVSSLLENQEETGTVTLVGDAKQAIYRWRGGKAEQFMQLSSGNSPFSNPDKAEIQLDTNFRSFSNVIEFNNKFFTFLSNSFSNEAYAELYKNGNKQNINSQEGGYVEFNFIEATNAEEKNELYPEKVVQNIEQIIENGFKYSDICILVRKNKEGVTIAEKLNSEQIPVLSYEALLIKNSNEVVLLTSFVDLIQFPLDKRKKLEFVKSLAVVLKIESQHEFISTYLGFSFSEIKEDLLEFGVDINFDFFNTQPIYEAFESLMRGFKFNTRSDANVQFFMDFVFEYAQKNNSGIASFITSWEQKKEKLSIVVPEGKNAVQIMSIHKSKGLEFPVVIYPFADTEIYKTPAKNVWFPIAEYSEVFSEAYISYNKKIFDQYSKETQLMSKEIRELQELDSFNVLYVALTRAREQLYVISNKKENKSKQLPEGSFQSYFLSFIEQSSKFKNKEENYFFGNPIKNSVLKEEIEPINEILFNSVKKEDNGIQTISSQNNLEAGRKKSIEWGVLLHDVMAKIHIRTNVEQVLFHFGIKLSLSDKEQIKLKKTVFEILNHPKLENYFSLTNRVFNEREFVFNNEVLRPDRIEVLNKEKVVIMDYKTGEEDVKNIRQIKKYGQIFEELGFISIKKTLIYIGKQVKIVEL